MLKQEAAAVPSMQLTNLPSFLKCYTRGAILNVTNITSSIITNVLMYYWMVELVGRNLFWLVEILEDKITITYLLTNTYMCK